MKEIKKIVLTGGPCGGKTSAISHVIYVLSSMGYTVLVVPETATEFIPNGVKPFGGVLEPYDFQKFVIYKQLFKENLYDNISFVAKSDRIVIIYDRGIMDSKSYVTADDFNRLLFEFGMKESEIMSRYDAVIHLVTAANGAEEFYTTQNNAARTETKEQAIELDNKTLNSWVGHNDLRVVDNSTGFDEKLDRVIKHIYGILGINVSIQKKLLIKFPDINILLKELKCTVSTIQQTYIASDSPDIEIKIRKIEINGASSYYLTEKRKVYSYYRTSKITTISEDDYNLMLFSARKINKSLHSICKKRIFFVYNNKYFYLDIFDFSSEYAMLEINSSSEEDDTKVPPFIKVIKDVTRDENFLNYNLAKTQKFII